jgi:hypothetical protein
VVVVYLDDEIVALRKRTWDREEKKVGSKTAKILYICCKKHLRMMDSFNRELETMF